MHQERERETSAKDWDDQCKNFYTLGKLTTIYELQYRYFLLRLEQ